jgi:hypothetical protein
LPNDIFVPPKIDLFVQYEFGISKAFDIDNPKKIFQDLLAKKSFWKVPLNMTLLNEKIKSFNPKFNILVSFFHNHFSRKLFHDSIIIEIIFFR